jgi:acyl-CoA synthetase (AMP-forming)/AMP-acid ligase II
MAEATFAVTQTTHGDPPRTLHVSRDALAHGRIDVTEEGERTLVSCGAPLPDVEVRITERATDDAIGDIELRGPFMMEDYLPSDDRPARWAWSPDGWYRTGDLGFLHDGHLYVTGRKKDVVIVGGVNVFPEDIEAAVGQLDGLYAGRVVAMGIEDEAQGTERLVVVAEARSDSELLRRDELELAIRKEVMASAGVAANYVFVVPPRWIVKSTAGKISRAETRARVLERWSSLEEGED